MPLYMRGFVSATGSLAIGVGKEWQSDTQQDPGSEAAAMGTRGEGWLDSRWC